MDNKIVVYTAIFGGKDALNEKDQLRLDGVDYVAFVDDPAMCKSKFWDVRLEKPMFKNDPVRSAKYYKIFPHECFPDHDISLWIDGRMALATDISDQIALLDETPMVCGAGIAKFGAKCAYTEAMQCIKLNKDRHEIINRQVEAYKAEGLPEAFGLWGASLMLRRHHDPALARFNQLWWQEIMIHSRRDQISLPYVVWKTGLVPTYFTRGIHKKLQHLK